jgi:hypothetical protein
VRGGMLEWTHLLHPEPLHYNEEGEKVRTKRNLDIVSKHYIRGSSSTTSSDSEDDEDDEFGSSADGMTEIIDEAIRKRNSFICPPTISKQDSHRYRTSFGESFFDDSEDIQRVDLSSSVDLIYQSVWDTSSSHIQNKSAIRDEDLVYMPIHNKVNFSHTNYIILHTT